jgi:hypothetical protein
MEQQGREIHVETDAARGGETPHIVRWVLGISLAMAIIAMSAVWLIPAMSGKPTIDDATQEAAAGR